MGEVTILDKVAEASVAGEGVIAIVRMDFLVSLRGHVRNFLRIVISGGKVVIIPVRLEII